MLSGLYQSMWTWWTVDCITVMEAQDISSLSVSLIHCIGPESLDLCDRGGVSPDVLDNQGPRRINTFISTCPPTLIRSTDALSQNWLQSEATQHNNLSGSNQNIPTNDIESKVKWSPGSLAYCRSCTRIFSSSKKDASLGKGSRPPPKRMNFRKSSEEGR